MKDCRDNTAGPMCEQCAKNFFRNEYGECVACNCHADGSNGPLVGAEYYFH